MIGIVEQLRRTVATPTPPYGLNGNSETFPAPWATLPYPWMAVGSSAPGGSLPTLRNGQKKKYFSACAQQDQARVRRSPLILAGARQGQAIWRRSPVILAGTRQDRTRPSRRGAPLLLHLILADK